MYRLIFLSAILAFGLSAISLKDAAARVFIGGGVVVGSPYYYYPPYYAYYPPYYPYPQASYPYYPPAYAPPPAASYPYPLPPPSPQDRYYTSSGQECREYQHSAIISGQKQMVVGHACLQPDGSWRIVD